MTPSVSTPKDQAREDERLRVINDHSLVGRVVDRGDGYITIEVPGVEHVTRAPDAFEVAASARPSPADPVRAALKGQWEAHSGEDYTVVMRPDEGTEYASIRVTSDDREELGPKIASLLNAARAAVSTPTGEGESTFDRVVTALLMRGLITKIDGGLYPNRWLDTELTNAIKGVVSLLDFQGAHPQQGGERDGSGLDLTALHTANIARQNEWCPDQHPDLSFRGNELAGGTGEACNVIKKLERERQGWRGSRATLNDLAEELADVVICADLCAVTAGIDLSAAVIAKFNATSEKVGISVKLPAAPTSPSESSGEEA